jgi:hypothetical protein
MKIQQLSVFLENQPGHLESVCQHLADAGLNILTLTLADTQQYGILRLIIAEAERARATLAAGGFAVTTTEVVAIEVEDRPGGLAAILRVVGQAGVNVEYMYAFTSWTRGRAAMVFRFRDSDRAIAALREAGVNVLGSVELFRQEEA